MRLLLLFLLILANSRVLPAQFTDNFSDGNLSQNPVWSGDTSHFQILQGQLALRAPTGISRSQITTISTAQLNAIFSGWVQLQFNPSSANYLDYYLISDSDSLHLPLQGLFLRFGHTLDEVSLYKQYGSTRTKVIDGPDGMLNKNDNQLRFELSRDSLGVWSLKVDTTGQGTSWLNLGSWADSTVYAANFSGLVCVFSSTRADKFYFDDLFAIGNSWQDSSPPRLLTHQFIQPRELRLFFDEALHPSTHIGQFIRPNNQQQADSVVWEAPNQLLIRFPSPFLSDIDHEIRLLAIADTLGNISNDTSVWVNYHQAIFGEIIIHELLPDPAPVQNLPEAEFVELYNQSGFTLNLKNYRWQDSGTRIDLPDYTLAAGEYVILCPLSSQAAYSQFGPSLGLPSWPALNNDSDRLRLTSADGTLIDSLQYQLNWYGDSDKQTGGWSLERRDPTQFCLQRENWSASTHPDGGTPGRPNSIAAVVIDSIIPQLSNYELASPDSLWLSFSKAVFNAGDVQITLNDQQISFFATSGDTSLIWLVVLPDGGIGNERNTLFVGGLRDCSGFMLSDTSITLAWPAWPEPGDWQVDEILFDAKSTNATFIEIVNASDKILNLKDIQFANPGVAGANNIVVLSEKNQLVFPLDRLVFTRNIGAVKADYPVHGTKFNELKSWPSMPQAGGQLALYRSDGVELCKWSYHPDNHFALLQETRGVSLERTNHSGPPVWHSAAIPPGATPGLPNSQQIRIAAVGSSTFTLDKQLFSPNADGQADDVGICWDSQSEGGILNIQVYSVQGQNVRQLAHQQLMSVDGCVYWDGLDDSGRRCATGRYILQVEAFWLDGRKVNQRLLVAVDTLDEFSP